MIGITTYSIDEILKVTGPLGVPDYDVTIASGETTLKTLQLTRAAAPGEDRKAFLPAFADVLIPTLASLRPEAWADLFGTAGTLRDGHHILAWFRDPAEQALAARAGIDGAVRQDPGTTSFLSTRTSPRRASSTRGHPGRWTSTFRSMSSAMHRIRCRRRGQTRSRRRRAPRSERCRMSAGGSSACTSGSLCRCGAACSR